jgi:protein-tyrosine phosphatase
MPVDKYPGASNWKYTRGIPLRLFGGHEALIKPELVGDIQADGFVRLNGSRYPLLELWKSTWLPEAERVIFELRAFGVIPVIAHPERYRAIQQDLHRLVALLQQGVITQLTASSLIGTCGNTIQRCAEMLLKKRVETLYCFGCTRPMRR